VASKRGLIKLAVGSALVGMLLAGTVWAEAAGTSGRGEKAGRWWNTDWRARKKVRVTLPRRSEPAWVARLSAERLRPGSGLLRVLPAEAKIQVEEDIPFKEPDFVVTDGRGVALDPPATWSRAGREYVIRFRLKKDETDYFIYYGHRGAQPPSRRPGKHAPAEPPIVMTAVRHSLRYPPSFFQHLRDAAEHLMSGARTQRVKRIGGSRNPLIKNASQRHVTIYEALLDCPFSGSYTFALDAGGAASLFIDGKLAVDCPGRGRASGKRKWVSGPSLQLASGSHYLKLVHADGGGRQGIYVGWRFRGSRRIALISSQSYLRAVRAEVVGLERQDLDPVVFFTARAHPEGVRLPDGRAISVVSLQNRTRLADVREVSWEWDLGDGRKLKQYSPTCRFDTGKPVKVSLIARREDEVLGHYARVIEPHSQVSGDPLALQLRIVQAPSIVYSEEKNAMACLVSSPGTTTPIWGTWQLKGRFDHEEAVLDQRETPSAAGPGSFVVPLDLTRLRGRPGTLELSVQVFDIVKVKESFTVLRPGPDVAKLRLEHGAFRDPEGRRAMILIDLEDQRRHGRWWLYKWFARQFRRPRGSVLLLADPMHNTPPPRESFVTYSDRIQETLRKAGKEVHFVRRSVGVNPILADVILLARQLEPTQPGVVVIAPGVADVIQAVPIRDYLRALDVMIDLIRRQPRPIEIVLVSPPPLVSNLALSASYARATEEIARTHNLRFVDLHARIRHRKDWKTQYQASPEERGVYALYPNQQAQADIARAILEMIP